jgi:hypothetical protein
MKCKTCGKNADSEYCFAHKSRKPLPSSGRGFSSNMNGKSFTKALKKDNERVVMQREFFLSIWKKRLHRCENCDAYLGSEPLSTFFHHILPKSKYPDVAYDKSNIILLTLPEHESVENDMYRFEEVNKRRIELLNKINQ